LPWTPNYEHNGKTDVKWQDVRHWCQHFNVEFRNQTFSALIQDLKEEYDKPLRNYLSKEERDMFLRDNPACSVCQKNLTLKTMQIDHVVPLSAGAAMILIICRLFAFHATSARPTKSSRTMDI